MSDSARPALRRVRWATGIPLDVEHFRAIDALIEARIRWTSASGAGVLPPVDGEKTFEVEGHVERGALWVKVSALQAMARDGGVLVVSPDRPLDGQAKIEEIRTQSAVQVWVVPDGWKEGPSVVERGLDDGGRFEEPGCRILFLQEDRDSRGTGLIGLKVGEFRMDRQGWRWLASFLPLAATMNATAATNRVREDILRTARQLRDRWVAPRPTVESAPEPPRRRGPQDRWITNHAYYTQGGNTTPMYSQDRKLATGGDATPPPPPPDTQSPMPMATPDATHALLGALAARLVSHASNPFVRPMDLHAETAGFADACHGVIHGKAIETRGMDGGEGDLTARFAEVTRTLGALGDEVASGAH